MPTNYHRLPLSAAVLAAARALAPPLISTTVLVVSTLIRDGNFGEEYLALAIVSALLFFLFVRAQKLRDALMSGWTIATQVGVAWVGVIGTLLLIGYATKVSAEFSRQALFVWFVLTPPLVTGALVVLRQWLGRALLNSGNRRSVVIAGVNGMSRKLAASIRSRPELGLELEGFFDDRDEKRLGEVQPGDLIGKLAELPDFVREKQIDFVFIAIPVGHLQRAKELLNELTDTTASIYFVPDIFFIDLIQARVDDVEGVPVVALRETPFHGWRGVVKRGSDILMALLMLILALPMMAVIAIAIKLTMPGSVIFRQRRYGLDGREIVVYKFRTMTVSEDGDGIAQATKNDARVTPLGRFLRRYSLDELPQLLNVLQGRMSVVGPRPHAVAHNEQYRKLIPGYMIRHKVTPGITGLAQINGCRGETTDLEAMKQRIAYDLDYLRHWSLLLDLEILGRTFVTMFRDSKAY